MCPYAGLSARTTALACRCLLSSGSRVRILPGALIKSPAQTAYAPTDDWSSCFAPRRTSMTELVEVVITAPDPDWLKNFSRKLVEQRLCASAHNFAPGRTFGAPRRRPEPATRAGASNRGEQSGRGTGDMRQGSLGVSPLRGGSFRRALRAEALRRDELPRTAAPAPAAVSPRRNAPMPRHTSRARQSHSRRVRRSPSKGHSHRAGTPRIVRAGPSSLNGASHPAARDAPAARR